MNITIEKAVPLHVNKLVKIENLSFSPDDSYSEETFLMEFEEHPNNIFLIKDDNKIIGYYISYKENNYYYLHSIAIHPKYRGLGIASTILWKYRIPEAIQLNCKSIRLHVNTNNIASIALYTKNGFQVKSRVKYYYSNGDHAFIMELKLA